MLRKILPEATRIGWVGTGIMGRHMCEHCMDAGFKATVFNRTLSKCDPLKKKGALVVSSPREVAENSDVVFSIVGLPSDVKQVALGQNGILAGLQSGSIYVDMTTSDPSLAQEIYNIGKEKDVSVVDAPVSGGDIGAKNGALSIMCGGDQEVFDSLDPLFNAMGKTVKYMGEAGAGQHTKMSNQVIIAGAMIGVCEGLLYAHKAGLNMDEVLNVVGGGAAGSFSLNAYGPRIMDRNFEPGFVVDHFVKDMGIALNESEKMKISLPGLALVKQMYVALQAQGHNRKGTQGLMLALETLNGIENHSIQYKRNME